jgi:hypothetical protein
MNADERRWTCRLLVATGVVLVMPAFAGDGDEVPNMGNSEAFRQGYKAGFDDGFSRGYQKGRNERGAAPMAAPPGPPPAPPRSTGPITITRAVYGSGNKICDATRWTRSRAQGRQTASLDVTNTICGDPAPGDRKSLEITYVCGSVPKTVSANEHRSVYLDCTP